MSIIRELIGDIRTSLYRNAIFLMANTLANNLFGFVFWMAIAWLYPTSEFGLATALIAAAMFVATLSRLGLDIGLVRYLPEAGEKESSMINSTFSISGGLAVIFAIVFLVGIELWSPALDFLVTTPMFAVGFVMIAVLFTVSPVMNHVFIAKRATKYMLLKTVVYGIARIGPPLVFVAVFGVFGIFASWGLGAFLALLVGWLFFMRKLIPGYRPIPSVSKTVVNDMLHFSAGNYVAGIMAMLPSLILPLMIINLATAELTAYFYVAWMIAGILFVIPGAVSTSLFAEGSHFQESLSRNVRKSLKLVFGLMAIGVLVILFFGNYVLLLFGNDFSEEAFGLLRLLALSGVFVSVNNVYLAIKRVEKNVTLIIAISSIIAIGTLGITYIFLPSMGLISVGIGWTLSQAVLTSGIGLAYLRRYSPKRLTH
jgi:O-antigen/teichoic acid export membrane protein